MLGISAARARRSLTLPALALCLAFVAAAGSAAAEGITRLEVTRVESPTFEGRVFGATGQYEKVAGRAYGEIDPSDLKNAKITDLDLAPRNARGGVEYATDFYLLEPIDPASGNHTTLYEAPNRGSKLMLNPLLGGLNRNMFNTVDPTTAADAGDGFAMEHGYSLLWTAWQGDVLPGGGRMVLDAPVAHHPDGSPITGPVRMDYELATPAPSVALASGWFLAPGVQRSYPPVSLDTTQATLMERVHQADPAVAVPAGEWSFGDCRSTPFPGVPSETEICLQGGFDTDHIYELTYTAKDPLVLGVGFAATRDLVSYLRSSPQSPLTGDAETVIGIGHSESGRFLRTFLDLGFNDAGGGRLVFDGVNPDLASGRVGLDVRFGQPGRAYGQHEDHDYPALEWPYSWGDSFDPNSKRVGGLLDACRRSRTCPKVMQTVTGSEYWGGRMSLDTTDVEGRHDLPIPPGVRTYYTAGTQHVPAYAPNLLEPSPLPYCKYLPNPAPTFDTRRALLNDFVEWVRDGRRPPASTIPTIRRRTLVDPHLPSFDWPPVPGVTYPALVNSGEVLDFGPGFDGRSLSGVISREPPASAPANRVLVPQVDADGNDLAGIRSTAIQAPLGTYTGWNVRSQGFAEGDLCPITGSFLPFARTKAERLASGDPRPSLEERYGSSAGYVAAVSAAAAKLVAERFLLPGDAERLVNEASSIPIP